MPTQAKLEWIAAMTAAGMREMEVASFVPPASMPQMADAAEVTRAARAAHPDLLVVVLAPNLRGAQNAAAAGAQSIILPVSASEAHSQLQRAPLARASKSPRSARWSSGRAPWGQTRPASRAASQPPLDARSRASVPERTSSRAGGRLAETGRDT